MLETEAFHLTAPTEEDLAIAQAAWRSGRARYARTLNLFDIRRPRDAYLVAPGKRAPDLSVAWPTAYDLTRSWAQASYDRLPDLDGIIYESHQVSGQCVVLYKPEKTTEPLFTIQVIPQSIREGATRELLLREARTPARPTHRSGAHSLASLPA
jgi:hypothetical protein